MMIPARWQKAGRSKPIRLIVVHCTVSPEMGTGAEAVANYFRTVERPASTHLVSDNNSTVRCVADGNTAYGAAGVNSDGLHIELVGMPQQTRVEWLDAYSRAELAEAGPYISAWSAAYQIPLRWLTVAEVRDGQTKGLCTHADASAAFPEISTGHWDPGPGFPKDEALRIWAPAPDEEDEDEMAAFELWRDGRNGKLYRVASSGLAKVWISDPAVKNVDYFRQGSTVEHKADRPDSQAWLDSVPTV